MIYILKFSKGHISVKLVDGVTVFVLCTSFGDAIYKFKVYQRVSDLQTQTEGSTLGWSQMLTDRRTNGKSDPCIAPCLRQVRQIEQTVKI